MNIAYCIELTKPINPARIALIPSVCFLSIGYILSSTH